MSIVVKSLLVAVLSATQAIVASASAAAPAEDVAAQGPAVLQEVVVTALKREENINDVGMSINAITGDDLVARGLQDPAQLSKAVPGFEYNTNAFGNPIYNIRGVGFQDSTLGASPTVTVYTDEVPIPFSAETIGAGLDVQRLEVLKGPQGTLYGENATGGALNFIAARPTDRFQAGVDASLGRFNTTDVNGFVSGPVTDTLKARFAARVLEGNDWQRSYTRSDTLGQQNLVEGRLLLDWQPIDKLRISLNLNAWNDRSDSPAPQLIGIAGLGNASLYPPLVAYPNSPLNARAADWDPGRPYQRNIVFKMGALRADYDLGEDLTLTSITSYQRYSRLQPIEADGTALQDLYLVSHGSIETFYQENRLAGSFAKSRGHWILGLNYQHDQVFDYFFEQFADSTSRLILGLPLSQTSNFTDQNVHTYAAYASTDYDITDTFNIQGGVRYTESDRKFTGCSQDTNGQAAAIFDLLQQVVKGGSYVPIPVGGCINLDPQTFSPALAAGTLNQHNLPWRVGLNWKAVPGTLLYGNVSRAYKAGSFPTLSASSTSQFVPAVQESLVAYELGFKSTLLDRTLQFNGSAFYYDYRDKQVLGRIADPLFGPLLTLINVPKSHVIGGELQAVWKPFAGLTISPDITYLDTRIDGNFTNYDSFGVLKNFTGETFPYTPKVQATLDAEYRWKLNERAEAFVGADVSHQSAANGFLGNESILDVIPYTLVDLRAGIEWPSWRVSIWGRNVTDKYYWQTVIRDNDTINRYAGMPATYGVTVNYRTQ